MPTLSAAASAEFSKLAPEAYPVLEITGISSVRRYAHEKYPVASATHGTISGRVVSWSGPLWYSLPRAQWTLEAVRYPVTIRDFDRDLTKLFEGGQWRNLRTATVKIRLASPGIPEAEWPVWFVGRIQGKPESAGPLTWRLKLATLDDAFRVGRIPHAAFNPAWFPNAKSGDLYGKAIPYVYGVQDSTDGTLSGAVGSCPAYFVGQVGSQYYCVAAYGECFHVGRVFKDGAVQTSTSWQRHVIEVPGFKVAATVNLGGTRLTVIGLTSNPGTSKITWDGVGYSREGVIRVTGSIFPVPITNPALQIRHFLNNFVLPADPYKNGQWLDWNGAAWVDNALLYTAAFDAAATWFEDRAYRGARWIGGDSPGDFSDGLRLLNEWAQTHAIQVYWRPDGKLGCRPWSPTTAVDLGGMTHWDEYDSEKNPVEPKDTAGDAEIASEISGDSWTIPSAGSQRAQLSVADLSLPRMVRRVSRPWAVARQRFPYENLHSPSAVWLAWQIQERLYDGQGLNTWHDVAATPDYNLTQGTAGNRPLLKLGARAALPSLVFDGADDFMTGPVISNLISASAFSVHFVFKATANGGAASDANAFQNPAIWSDDGSFVGAHLQFTGGQNYLQAYAWDGAARVCKVPISLNTWYVAQMSLRSGVLRVGVKNFVWATVSSGNITTLTGTMEVGRSGIAVPTYFTGELMALIFQTSGDLEAQGLYAGINGGGWHHLMFESLADLLRISEAGWAY